MYHHLCVEVRSDNETSTHQNAGSSRENKKRRDKEGDSPSYDLAGKVDIVVTVSRQSEAKWSKVEQSGRCSHCE